ncbi:MAG: tetratricopeptide repeat protein [Deltaproteobacteria bacterium]|nr:tetratricopeptide repeat protein [Deltaproteobacteria bacterium]
MKAPAAVKAPAPGEGGEDRRDAEPRGFDGLMRRGNELRTADPGGALELFEKALEQKPGHPEVHHKVGDCLYRLGRHRDAVAHFRTAIEASGFRASFTRIAQSLAALGDRAAAVRYLEQGLQQYPGDSLMKSMLDQYR